MPLTVDNLFKSLSISYEGPFKWKEKINAKFNGVYIISLESKVKFDLCPSTFKYWKDQAKDLEINGRKVKKLQEVKEYLEKFWNKNESILYIGESTSKTNPIQKRINQFYIHKVGQKGPHTGGYWLKLLPYLGELSIYYAKVDNPREVEFKLLMKYVELTTGKSFYDLQNFSLYFPFANLKADILKPHTIRNYTNKNSREKNGG